MTEPDIPLPSEGASGIKPDGTATATCLCGTVQLSFPVEGEGLVNTFVCNCTDCHKLSSSMFCSNFTVKDAFLKHLRGEDKLSRWAQNKTVASGATMEDSFCSVCGNLMYRRSSRFPDMSILRIGTVDDFSLHESKLKPQLEQFIKSRCDFVRPTCGRCSRQGLICSGRPLDAVFVFRNENEVAARNSQRARRQGRQTSASAASASSFVIPQSQEPQGVADVVDGSLQREYPWLNERALAEIPSPLKRGLEDRAVERFFVNWTLYPSNHGTSLGHMHDLPMHFLSAQPDSVLWLAVRAMAFADVRNESVENVPFYIKARQQYGAALNSMRMMINNQHELGTDPVLSAMLLVDNFELIHLARSDPLGSHNEAIRHVLRSRGDGQLYHPTRFSLWRLSHYRLQFWQTLLRQQPDAQQIAWMNKLNIERPDLRICADVLQMNILSAIAKTLAHSTEVTETARINKLNQARQLAQEMQDLTATIDGWTSEMNGVWMVKAEDPQNIAQPQDVDESPEFPIPHFPYPYLLKYEDISLAYIWNFYAASQIVLRESLVDVINYITTLQNQDVPDEDNMANIQQQRDRVDMLSGNIIGSFPMLLGFTPGQTGISPPRLPQQGKMAGRLFALCSMWIIQRARFVSAQHKQTASDVVAWITSRHGLG